MNRLAGLRFAPTLVCGAVAIWAGTRVAASSAALALLMMAIGAITLVLALRMMVGDRSTFESTGELTTPHFDYLIWTGLIVPMLLVVALLIIAVSGALTSR